MAGATISKCKHMIIWPEIPMHLHQQPVDFRQSINGLVNLIENSLGLSPFDEALYIFGNRQRNKIKVVYWDKTGFCLWYKRLEQNKFHWPKPGDEKIMVLTHEQFSWLLRGLDIKKLTPHPIKTYQYCS
jgi:transposase